MGCPESLCSFEGFPDLTEESPEHSGLTLLWAGGWAPHPRDSDLQTVFECSEFLWFLPALLCAIATFQAIYLGSLFSKYLFPFLSQRGVLLYCEPVKQHKKKYFTLYLQIKKVVLFRVFVFSLKFASPLTIFSIPKMYLQPFLTYRCEICLSHSWSEWITSSFILLHFSLVVWNPNFWNQTYIHLISLHMQVEGWSLTCLLWLPFALLLDWLY